MSQETSPFPETHTIEPEVIGCKELLGWTLQVSLRPAETEGPWEPVPALEDVYPDIQDPLKLREKLSAFEHTVTLIHEADNPKEGWIRVVRQPYNDNLAPGETYVFSFPLAVEKSEDTIIDSEEAQSFGYLLSLDSEELAALSRMVDLLIDRLSETDKFLLLQEVLEGEIDTFEVEQEMAQIDAAINKFEPTVWQGKDIEIDKKTKKQKHRLGQFACAALLLAAGTKWVIIPLLVPSENNAKAAVAAASVKEREVLTPVSIQPVATPKEKTSIIEKPTTTIPTTTTAIPAKALETTVPPSTATSLPPTTATPEVVQAAPRPLPSEAEAQQEVMAYMSQNNMSDLLDHVRIQDNQFIGVNITSRNVTPDTPDAVFCVDWLIYDWNNPGFIFETNDNNGNVVQIRLSNRADLEARLNQRKAENDRNFCFYK